MEIDLVTLIKVIVMIVGGMGATAFFKLAISICRTPKGVWESNRQALSQARNGANDYNKSLVITTVGVDPKTNTWITNHQASEHAVDRVLTN